MYLTTLKLERYRIIVIGMYDKTVVAINGACYEAAIFR